MDLATHLGGALIAFAIAAVTAPAGVSGAVLLVPVQVSILGGANPAITPTNLLYNVTATPGAIAGYRRRPEAQWDLAKPLISGALPGVVIGAFLRVEVLDQPRAFYGVVAAVLLPLGIYLLARPSPPVPAARPVPNGLGLAIIAFGVGIVGGIYGIGGGSVLAPLLVASGFALTRVAPAAVVTTLATSILGVATFAVLAAYNDGPIAADWSLGIALGIGGLLGGYAGASLQHRLPERLIRQILGVLSAGLAIRYAAQATGLF
jgi:uncharacterized membrane protein YfcA